MLPLIRKVKQIIITYHVVVYQHDVPLEDYFMCHYMSFPCLSQAIELLPVMMWMMPELKYLTVIKKKLPVLLFPWLIMETVALLFCWINDQRFKLTFIFMHSKVRKYVPKSYISFSINCIISCCKNYAEVTGISTMWLIWKWSLCFPTSYCQVSSVGKAWECITGVIVLWGRRFNPHWR